MCRRLAISSLVVMGLFLTTLLVVGLCLTTSPAQEAKKEEAKKEAKKKEKAPPQQEEQAGSPKAPKKGPGPGEVEIHFLNGSNVRLVVKSTELDIATPYGKLSVPIRDIRFIEFGLHFPQGYAGKIDRAVKDLDSANFRERENASKTLVELGPFSYAAVYQVSRAKNLEISRRGKEILKKLQANHTKKDLKLGGDDKVITPTFTIVGRILTPSIKVDAEYFGEAVLSLSRMRTLRALASAFRDVDLTVDAAKYGSTGQWLETDFHTNGRLALAITAKGLVDLMPQQGAGQNLVGPSGLQAARFAAGGAGGFGGGKGGKGGRGGGAAAGAILPKRDAGTLFGKIGENGDIFVIGEHYEGTPESEGTLYLHIGPSPYENQSTGSYQVRISSKN